MNLVYKKYIPVILIIILGFAVYVNSLNGKFILDDNNLVKNNSYIKSFTFLSKSFTKDLGAASGEKYNYYRPIQTFTYMIDYFLWKLDVRGYHLSSVILHILVTLTLYQFIKLLFGDGILAFFTSLLFLVHPVNVEAVAFISARDNILGALFQLLTFIFYIRLIRENRASFYILMIVCYILALLSKEAGIILPFLFLLYHYTFKERVRPKPFLWVTGIGCGYIFLRLTALPTLAFYAGEFNKLFERLPGVFAAVTAYMRDMIFPVGLHIRLSTGPFSFNGSSVIAGMMIISALFFLAFLSRRQNKIIFFALCWFSITLLPAANLVPLGSYMADRWLYIPAIGFFLIAAYAFSLGYRNKRFRVLTAVFFATLVALYFCLTIKQNTYWRDPVAFFKKTLQYTPQSFRAYDNLGNAYSVIGENEKAIAAYKKAIDIEPQYGSAYNNLGNIYYYMGNFRESIASYKKALEIDPESAKACYNMGNAYYDMGGIGEAIAAYKEAIKINPDYGEALNRLAEALYIHKSDTEKAVALLNKAIAVDPYYAQAYNNLGVIYDDNGREDEAISLMEEALNKDPKNAIAHNNLAMLYYRRKEYRLAIEHCDKALSLGHDVSPRFLEELKAYRD